MTADPRRPGGYADPHDADPAGREDLSALFGRLGGLFSSLVRSEIDLAKAEAGEKAMQLGLGAGAVIGGAMVSLAGVIVFFEGLVAAMRDFAGIHPAISGVVATILIAAIAGWLVYRGVMRLRPSGLVPRRTMRSLKRDRELVESLGR